MPPHTCFEYQRHHHRTPTIKAPSPTPSWITRLIWGVWLLLVVLLFAPTIIKEHRSASYLRFQWNRARKEKKRK